MQLNHKYVVSIVHIRLIKAYSIDRIQSGYLYDMQYCVVTIQGE